MLSAAVLAVLQMRDFSVSKFETPQILKPLWQDRGEPSINLFFCSIISFKSQA